MIQILRSKLLYIEKLKRDPMSNQFTINRLIKEIQLMNLNGLTDYEIKLISNL